MYYVTTKTAANSLVCVLATIEKRDAARAYAKANEGTVRTQAEIDALIAAEKLDCRTLPGYVAPEVIAAPVATGIMALAETVAKGTKTRLTLGTKDKANAKKRVATSDEVLAQARAFIANLHTDTNKVDTVRLLASWKAQDGTKLQRRDGLALLAGIVNPATVSTQWQLIRSGKLTIDGEKTGE